MRPHYRNPVLPGFHPDPSVCRVGADVYLVTSSFEYFPGLPVFHSRDLVHWRPIGHVVHRVGQLDLSGVPASGGLYAPTLRHAHGRFWVVCTLVGPRGDETFVTWADDVAGPWSDAVVLPGARGIDPSLFLDDDGSMWLTGCREIDHAGDPGHTEIWLRRFDPDAVELVGDESVIFRGALRGAVWDEAPHLYRRDGRYVLIVAEGGTEDHHSVVVATCDRVDGDYVPHPVNPVLTHRHLGPGQSIAAVGHADLVDAPDGSWWAFVLGVRPRAGLPRALGRETFIVPMTWHDGVPVMAPGVGRVVDEGPGPDVEEQPWPVPDDRERFGPGPVPAHWVTLRAPRGTWFDTDTLPGRLWLPAGPEPLTGDGSPSIVLRRVEHLDSSVEARLDVSRLGADDRGGLVLWSDDRHHVRLELRPGAAVVALACDGGVERELGRAPWPVGGATAPVDVLDLAWRASPESFQASFGVPGAEKVTVVTGRTPFPSAPEAARFTGPMVGIWAVGAGGKPCGGLAVEWFAQGPAQ